MHTHTHTHGQRRRHRRRHRHGHRRRHRQTQLSTSTLRSSPQRAARSVQRRVAVVCVCVCARARACVCVRAWVGVHACVRGRTHHCVSLSTRAPRHTCEQTQKRAGRHTRASAARGPLPRQSATAHAELVEHQHALLAQPCAVQRHVRRTRPGSLGCNHQELLIPEGNREVSARRCNPRRSYPAPPRGGGARAARSERQRGARAATLTQRLPSASSARLPALPQCSTGGVTTAGGTLPSRARLPPSRSRLAAANSISVAMTPQNGGGLCRS